MIRFIVTLLTALALFCSQASAGFLLNSFAVKSPLVFVGASKAEGVTTLSTTLTGGISSTIEVGDLLVAIVGNAHTTTITPAISAQGVPTERTISTMAISMPLPMLLHLPASPHPVRLAAHMAMAAFSLFSETRTARSLTRRRHSPRAQPAATPIHHPSHL